MIPGIGVKRRQELLKTFSSLKKIKEASIEELSKIIPTDVAIELQKYLESQDNNEKGKSN